MNKIDTSKVVPSLLKASTGAWTWDDGNHHLPYHWGTEALAWRTDKWESSYADLSYGDLWTPEMKGKVMGRPHSMMAGSGIYLREEERRIGKEWVCPVRYGGEA